MENVLVFEGHGIYYFSFCIELNYRSMIQGVVRSWSQENNKTIYLIFAHMSLGGAYLWRNYGYNDAFSSSLPSDTFILDKKKSIQKTYRPALNFSNT